MSKRQLERLMDDAIDAGDFQKASEISKYIK